MATTEQITPSRASSPLQLQSDVCCDAGPAATAEPSFGEIVDEINPLVGAVPLYGPPVVVLVAPWLLLSLMLVGPWYRAPRATMRAPVPPLVVGASR